MAESCCRGSICARQKLGSRLNGCGQTAATIAASSNRSNEKAHTKDHAGRVVAPNGQYRVSVAAAKALTEEATCVLKQRETREVESVWCERCVKGTSGTSA